MRRRLSPLSAVAGFAIVLAAQGCADLGTAPNAPPPRLDEAATGATADSSASNASSPAGQLIVCPTQDEQRATAIIGPGGGSVSARGTSLSIPEGAVPEPTRFELTIPASRYMEVEVHAVGYDSYTFQQPVTLTINYARCPDDAAPTGATLAGAYIDSATDQILALMGGSQDKSGHKLTFTTGHLSGYAVAY
jgi:hypothetical protein